jgi:hypothetical protein
MPRTTVDLDAAVLRELKRRSRALEWRTAPMRARVDVRDKEALHRALDGR